MLLSTVHLYDQWLKCIHKVLRHQALHKCMITTLSYTDILHLRLYNSLFKHKMYIHFVCSFIESNVCICILKIQVRYVPIFGRVVLIAEGRFNQKKLFLK